MTSADHKPLHVIINGAHGRMGKMAQDAVNLDPSLTLVGALDKNHDLADEIKKQKADVVVDLTTPHVVYQNTLTIIEQGAHPVIGTTGLTPEQIVECQNLAKNKECGGVIAPNFSIAALLMMSFAQKAVKWMPDVEIIEYHHEKKIDAPSGTAIKTAELIQEASEKEKDIPIHSVRLPGLFAHQMVLFGGDNETLTIKHDAFAREAMRAGLIQAIKTVPSLKKLIYGLENIIDL